MRQTSTTLATALMGSPLFILVALGFVLQPDPAAGWGPWPLVVVALGVGGVLLAEVVGYRSLPISPDTEPATATQQAQQRWQTGVSLRFALTEAPFILTIALVFVVASPQPTVLVAVSAVIAVLGLALHVWPWTRPVEKFAQELEKAGGRTSLREDLGITSTR